MPGADDGPHRHDDTTRTRWPWDSPFAWAMPPQRRHRRRRRKSDEAEDLARLRRTWGDAYVIPHPFRRWWQLRPDLTAWHKQTILTLRARSADALERAILEDYALRCASVAHARVVAEEAAKAPAEPVAAMHLPPDDDCVSPSMMTCIDLPPGRHRPYVPDGKAS